MDTLEELVAHCQINGRICPQPYTWNKFWKILPDKQRSGAGWEPSLPLILGAWSESSNLEKQVRFGEHLRWAEAHGALEAASRFLRALSEEEWHHL